MVSGANDQLIAGVETGGTKILARICHASTRKILSERRWATTSADEAADRLTEFLLAVPGGGQLAAVGMAAFGPLIVDPGNTDCGRMLETPKPGWSGSNLRADLAGRLGVPVAVDTDVNAAAVAEQVLGAGKGHSHCAYVTVGTGIGAGLAINGQSLKGALHPEMGHLRLVRRSDDTFPSICPFHPDCTEGLVSGPAVRARIGEGSDLSGDPRMIGLVGGYLGQLAAALVLAWSPQRIVWGGGVIRAVPLLPTIAASLRDSLGGYGVGTAVDRPQFCVAASLEHAGLEGALLMAQELAAQPD